ncbi:MAG: murein biosynthesis integral membrane protein MurJ [Rhabdaerophilum sp.]
MSLAVPFTIVGSATLLSRVTGFVRDILVAALLGTGAIAEAYVAAFLIPNLVRRMMSEGGLHAAVVPRLARLEQEGGPKAARVFADDLLAMLSVVAILVVLVAEIFMPQIMSVLAHGFVNDPQKFENAVLFARIAFPFVGFTLVLALYAALLNSVERYAAAALVPVVLNLLLIGVMVALLVMTDISQRRAGLFLVITILAAGVIQLVLLAISVSRSGFSPFPPLSSFRSSGLSVDARAVLLLAFPGMLIAGAGHIHLVLASQFASLTPRGLAALYFADRLFQLPLGFAASAIGIVLLPRISRALQARDEAALNSARGESFHFAALLILPAATALYLLSDPIISVLFQRGAFSAEDTLATAANLRVLALALPAFVLAKIILPEFLAEERMRVPLIAAFLACMGNIGSVLVLRETYGTLAPAMGVAIGAWFYAALLMVLARNRLRLGISALKGLLGAALATIGMGVTLFFLVRVMMPFLDPAHGFLIKGSALSVLCLAGLGLHLGLARLLGVLDLKRFRVEP